MIVDIRSSPNIPSHPSSAEPVRTGTYQYRYSYSYHLRTTAHQRCPVLVSVRVYKYATRTPVCRGAKCVRVPAISQHTRTGSYHRPNKTRGSYYAMTLLRVLHTYRNACAYLKLHSIRVPARTIVKQDSRIILRDDATTSTALVPGRTGTKQDSRIILRDDATTSTALVPGRTGTNIPGSATTVCTGATCVRVPQSTSDTRTGSYHHPNNTQGSYHAMFPRLPVRELRVLHSSKDYVQAPHAYSTPAILATRLHG